MLPRSLLRPGLASLLLVLQACAQTPEEPVAPASAMLGEVAEITLNLPDDAPCNCVQEVTADYTFLEKGFAALAAGNYADASEHFRRYRRLESSPEANWEAGIAIAFLESLGASPYHDAEKARKRYRDLMQEDWQSMKLHEQTLLLRQSLENFHDMDRKITGLKKSNKTLQKDLEKREEAIKRLRELTLGQPAAAQ